MAASYIVLHYISKPGRSGETWERGDVVTAADLYPGLSDEERAPLIARLRVLYAISDPGATLIVDGGIATSSAS